MANFPWLLAGEKIEAEFYGYNWKEIIAIAAASFPITWVLFTLFLLQDSAASADHAPVIITAFFSLVASFALFMVPAILVSYLKLAITRYYVTDRRLVISHTLPFFAPKPFAFSDIAKVETGRHLGIGWPMFPRYIRLTINGEGWLYGRMSIASNSKADEAAAFLHSKGVALEKN